MNKNIKYISKGFTLVELMVAMAIFALMAAMMYGGFQSIVTAKSSTDRNAGRLKSLQMTYLQMGRDLRQLTNRSIRDEFGVDREPIISAQTGTYLLELSRGGYPNPGGFFKRSNIQRVAYGIEDNILYKYSWSVLDRAQDAKPTRIKLLDNIDQLQFRFLTQQKEWVDAWPPPLADNTQTVFPVIAEVTLELKDWGRFTRIYELPGLI